MKDYTQKANAKSVVDLGNKEFTSAEEPRPLVTQEREAENLEMIKSKPLDHDEDFFHADLNAFGNGHTTLDSEEKPGWKDPK